MVGKRLLQQGQDMGKNTENGMDKGIDSGMRRKDLVRNLSHSQKGWSRDGTTAFYIETLAILVVFTIVTVVLVNGFVLARKLSREAGVLTDAVHLAENAAEMAAASDSGEMLFEMLDEAGNAFVLDQENRTDGSVYCAEYDSYRMPAADGIYHVNVSWLPQEDGLVRSVVEVYWDKETEPVYRLETAIYTGDS